MSIVVQRGTIIPILSMIVPEPTTWPLRPTLCSQFTCGHPMLPILHFRPHYALQHSQLSLALRAMLCENGKCQLIHEREISGG
jgi:hypothetical protein